MEIIITKWIRAGHIKSGGIAKLYSDDQGNIIDQNCGQKLNVIEFPSNTVIALTNIKD